MPYIMDIQQLQAHFKNIEEEEESKNYRKITYKGKIVKFNNDLILYGDLYIRFPCSVMFPTSALVFIQSDLQTIYSTNNFTKFEYIAQGKMVGVIGKALIYENDGVFYILANNLHLPLYFYFNDDKLYYKHEQLKVSKSINVQGFIYMTYFVVFTEKNIMFVDQESAHEVQFRLPSDISKAEVVQASKIQILLIEYQGKNGTLVALFYGNNLILQKIDKGFLHIKAKKTKNNDEDHGSAIHLLNASKDTKETWAEDSKRDTNGNIFYMYQNYQNDWNNLGFDHVYDIKIKNNSTNDTKDISIIEKFKEMTKNELIAFEMADITQKLVFLRSFLNDSKDCNIFSKIGDSIFHFCSSIQRLTTKDPSNYALIQDKLQNTYPFFNSVGFSYFYDSPVNLINTKYKNKLCFNRIFTKDELEWLDRKYSRIFFYNSKVNKAKSLAYKTIEYEKKYDNIDVAECVNMINENYKPFGKKFLKLFKKYHGDERMKDVVSFMLEYQIHLDLNPEDLNNYRLNAFLARTHLNIGAFIMNHKHSYYHSLIGPSVKYNSANADKYMSKELDFLNAICMSPYCKELEQQSFEAQAGFAFGRGLSSGLDSDIINSYLKLVPTASKHQLAFVFLVLSTQNFAAPFARSCQINKILKSGLENSTLELKKAAACALAIYNHETNDKSILKTLQRELLFEGPVMNEKNAEFYDRNYQTLIAISMGSIATRPYTINTQNTFSNLLVMGLSSIGKDVDIDQFYRCALCRPDELFYSTLFSLTSNFQVQPCDILDSFSIDATFVYRDSARLFYVALHAIYTASTNRNDIYMKLFSSLEKIIKEAKKDSRIKTLLNYALIACSIIKAGSCDYSLLKILRKEILKTGKIRFLEEQRYFDIVAKESVKDIGVDKESVMFHKICVGIVCADFGMSTLSKDSIKKLILTFFYTGSIMVNFSYIDILRCLIVKGFVFDNEKQKQLIKTVKKLYLKHKRKLCMKYFKSKFIKMHEIDQKFTIDILSDYYENYNNKNNKHTVFDLEMLARLLSISK